MYPILFEFGSVTIFSLWFFIAIGFTVGSAILVNLAKRNRLKLNIIADSSFFLFFWTLLVSRLFFVLSHLELFFYQFSWSKLLAVFAIWDKGLSFWGAAAAWISGMIFLHRKYGESPAKLLDITMPAILTGMFFGNIGAFLDGINYGMPTKMPWGITFLSANVKYISPIHPTQLYAALYTLGLGLGLIYLLKKLKGRLAGFAAELAVFAFGLVRFFEEFVRGDEAIRILTFRLPQIIALLAVLWSGKAIYERYTNKNGGDPNFLISKFFKKLFKKKPKSAPEEWKPEIKTSVQNPTV